MIKPIETVYNGYRFRSRLEARWAVFFDALGVRYDYEREGFKLADGTQYLPDFWLPEQRVFVEIKGTNPSNRDRKKLVQLALGSEKNAFLFYGSIPRNTRDNWYSFCLGDRDESGGTGMGFVHYMDVLTCCAIGDPHPAWWSICDSCGAKAIDFIGYEASCCEQPNINTFHPAIDEAYKTARSARFEHGEVPTL